MTLELILGLVRHALTFGGGFLIPAGYATGDEVQTWTGAIITIVGAAWSLIRKWRRPTPQPTI